MKQSKRKIEFQKFWVVLLALSIGGGCAQKTSNSSSEPGKDGLLELAQKSKMAPVPQRVQLGPTCGLYALGMVMDYWHGQDSREPTVLVSDDDLLGRGRQYNFDPTSQERMLPFVQKAGYSTEGEMFSAESLSQTAIHFGYHSKTYSHATLDDLYRLLDQRHPAIVAFDVDWFGNPALYRGDKAHYAVVEGYFDDQGTRYVVARHGWGVEKDHIWKASDLFASMKNLTYTEFYKARSLPSLLTLPLYQNNPDRIDITQSLGNKIIEVFPKAPVRTSQQN